MFSILLRAGLCFYCMCPAWPLGASEVTTSMVTGQWDTGGGEPIVLASSSVKRPVLGGFSCLAWTKMNSQGQYGLWQSQLSSPTLFIQGRNRSFHNVVQLSPVLGGPGKLLLFVSVRSFGWEPAAAHGYAELHSRKTCSPPRSLCLKTGRPHWIIPQGRWSRV